MLRIKGRNMKITTPMRDYIYNKYNKLAKYKPILWCDITSFNADKDGNFLVKLNLMSASNIYYQINKTYSSKDWYSAIDNVFIKVKRTLNQSNFKY